MSFGVPREVMSVRILSSGVPREAMSGGILSSGVQRGKCPGENCPRVYQGRGGLGEYCPRVYHGVNIRRNTVLGCIMGGGGSGGILSSGLPGCVFVCLGEYCHRVSQGGVRGNTVLGFTMWDVFPGEYCPRVTGVGARRG
ncbi:hypothetical protein DPMN_053253 [Dreissena polymorpha]|uniref:Uncharacterized protein n=1 Tax=Dreissena polymorpha TaxID=45954 RepID=A0A9D4CM93_DREPO|nr:hypothetical protein DPMN_053253 [Dreissena polymorpha]